MQYQRIKLWFSNESSKYKKGKMRKNSFFHIKSGGAKYIYDVAGRPSLY
jgi:hypothetical protein